jgi:hypothetical protein
MIWAFIRNEITSQLVKKLPAIHGTDRILTWLRTIPSTPTYPLFHFPLNRYTSTFKSVSKVIPSSIHIAWLISTNVSPFSLVCYRQQSPDTHFRQLIIIFGEERKMRNSTSCSFSILVILSFILSHMFFSPSCFQTLWIDVCNVI